MVSLFQYMDKSLRRVSFHALWPFVSLLTVGGILFAIMSYSQPLLGLTSERIEGLILRGAQSPFALLCVVTVFILVAFSGIPHLYMIIGTLSVFGLPGGAIYAWVGLMSGAVAMYLLGAWSFRPRSALPAATPQNIAPLSAAAELMRHHGVTACSLLWLAPAQVFVIANVLLGAVRVPFHKFLIGTGIAASVKIMLIVILSDQLHHLYSILTSKEPVSTLTLLGTVGLWLGIVLLVRQFVVSSIGGSVITHRD